jgi:hypothetical protein
MPAVPGLLPHLIASPQQLSWSAKADHPRLSLRGVRLTKSWVVRRPDPCRHQKKSGQDARVPRDELSLNGHPPTVVMVRPRACALRIPRTGSGEPPTTFFFIAQTLQSRGWSAFADHDIVWLEWCVTSSSGALLQSAKRAAGLRRCAGRIPGGRFACRPRRGVRWVW